MYSKNIENHSYRGYTIAGSKVYGNNIIKLKRNLYTQRPIYFIFSGIGSECLNMGK